MCDCGTDLFTEMNRSDVYSAFQGYVTTLGLFSSRELDFEIIGARGQFGVVFGKACKNDFRIVVVIPFPN